MINQIDLQSFNIQRPEKIRWRFDDPQNDIFSGIKSKSLRKFLHHTDEILAKNVITYEYKSMTKSEFRSWLEYYRIKMTEKKYDFFANEDWFDQKISEGYVNESLFFYQNEQLIGSAIIRRKNTEIALLCFKASDPISISSQKNGSLGSIIDFVFIKLMKTKKVDIISGGKSRNAFGVLNTLGYFNFKMNFYTPSPAEDIAFVNTVPVNEEGIALFYGLKDNAPSLFAFKPKSSDFQFEQIRLSTSILPVVEMVY